MSEAKEPPSCERIENSHCETWDRWLDANERDDIPNARRPRYWHPGRCSKCCCTDSAHSTCETISFLHRRLTLYR